MEFLRTTGQPGIPSEATCTDTTHVRLLARRLTAHGRHSVYTVRRN